MKRGYFFLSAALTALVLFLVVLLILVMSGHRFRSISVDGGKLYYYGTAEEGTVYTKKGKARYFADGSRLVYDNGDEYVGEIEHYLPNGEGVFRFSSGGVIEGSFVNGLAEGYGKETLVSGNFFEGYFVKGEWTGSGKVTVVYSDAEEILEGDFTASRINGEMTYLYRNGATYVGGYRNGLAEGMGKLTYPNGDVYEGSFVGGELSGMGRYTFADGSCYVGQFSRSMPNGFGSYTYEKNGVSVSLAGTFVNGVWIGSTEN